jgi:nucleotide-binding universal stress UspA family protein
MILIGYDGSDDAKAAIEQAAALFRDQPATVLTVWEPYSAVVGRTPAAIGILRGLDDLGQIDEECRKSAQETADSGAGLARAAGLTASAAICSRTRSVAEAILVEADRLNAGAIVLGSRGLGGVGSILLGSVSHAVLQHGDRPVFIVPSPKVASSRNEKLRAHVASPA